MLNFVKKTNWRNWFIYLILIALVAVFAGLNSRFLTVQNLQNIGRQTAMVSIVALGATFVITTGHIDLSCGSTIGLVGVLSAFCLRNGLGIALASLAGILTGLLIGLFNGIVIAKLKIPAFLVTLGTMQIARGVALTVTNTKAVNIMTPGFTEFWGASSIGGFPTAIIWTIILFIVAFWLYQYNSFGNHVKAIGGNIQSSVFSGINVNKVTIYVFLIASLMSAVAGLIMAARLKSGRPEVGSGMEMDAIAAVVLGGTALSGGKGKIFNTIIGSLIIGVIINGLTIMGAQYNIQQIIKGIIIIVAVALSEGNKK
jgi:ribose transport system permease protein